MTREDKVKERKTRERQRNDGLEFEQAAERDRSSHQKEVEDGNGLAASIARSVLPCIDASMHHTRWRWAGSLKTNF